MTNYYDEMIGDLTKKSGERIEEARKGADKTKRIARESANWAEQQADQDFRSIQSKEEMAQLRIKALGQFMANAEQQSIFMANLASAISDAPSGELIVNFKRNADASFGRYGREAFHIHVGKEIESKAGAIGMIAVIGSMVGGIGFGVSGPVVSALLVGGAIAAYPGARSIRNTLVAPIRTKMRDHFTEANKETLRAQYTDAWKEMLRPEKEHDINLVAKKRFVEKAAEAVVANGGDFEDALFSAFRDTVDVAMEQSGHNKIYRDLAQADMRGSLLRQPKVVWQPA